MAWATKGRLSRSPVPRGRRKKELRTNTMAIWLDRVAAARLRSVLVACDGNLSKACRSIGIPHSSAQAMLERENERIAPPTDWKTLDERRTTAALDTLNTMTMEGR